MSNYNSGKVTPRVYDAVKLLLESGSSQAEVARYMKLSQDVVGFIARSENLEEYKALMYERYKSAQQKRAAAINAKKASAEKDDVPEQKVVEYKQSVTIQATHYMETKLDQVIEQMKLINAKLGAIIDDLYGTGKKAGA